MASLTSRAKRGMLSWPKRTRGPEVKLNFLTSVKSNCIQFYRFFLPSLNSDYLQKSAKHCIKNPPKYVISHSAARGLCQGIHELKVANYFLGLYLICFCTCILFSRLKQNMQLDRKRWKCSNVGLIKVCYLPR